jgi:hypothetical protein
VRGALVAAAVLGIASVPARAALADPPGHGDGPRHGDGVFERAQVEVGPAKKPIRTVTVDNPLGDVRVEGHDGKNVVILAYKRAPDDDTLDRLRVSLVPDPDGAVHIVTAVDGGREVRPVSRRAVRIDLVIRAPRDARVDGRVHDGKLELINMDAGGELDAAAGTITVENVSGAVSAHAVTASERFQTVFGAIEAQIIAGDLHLDSVGGDRLSAMVHDGRIIARRVRSRRVELRTTRGDIVLDGDMAAGGDLIVASLRGDVSVTLHRGVPVRVRARGAHVTLPGGGRLVAAGGDTRANDPLEFAGFGAHARATPAALEIQSRYGVVRFALVP